MRWNKQLYKYTLHDPHPAMCKESTRAEGFAKRFLLPQRRRKYTYAVPTPQQKVKADDLDLSSIPGAECNIC